MEDEKLVKASEVAEILGGRWTRSMVHTYLNRGKLPQPVTYVGNQPLWKESQFKKIKKEGEKDGVE